jgi:prepilin-type N-terminal cleavage/methylation domain-containing protein
MRIAPSQREMVRPQSMRRHRSSDLRHRRDAGFSLAELLIVMALVAMMALVAVPWFVKISQRQQIKSAAQEISIALAAARMTAVKRNAQISFAVASSTPPLSFQTIEPNPPAPTPTPVPRRLDLPAKSARFQGPAPAPIIFGGDGRVVAGTTTFIVEGPVGMATPNPITIIVNGNGRIEVRTPTTWQ